MQCSIPDCDNKVFVNKRGWCKGHYLRWWRNGSPTAGTYYIHHGLVGTPIRNMWSNIKARIYNPKSQYYYCYGGRGIGMYEPWKDNFMEFYQYIIDNLGNHPGKGYSIDRINNNGDYEPGNLRWATAAQQSTNRNSGRNASGYKGVSWKTNNHKYQAAIRSKDRTIYLGLFEDPEQAALAYDSAAIQLHGDYALLNLL